VSELRGGRRLHSVDCTLHTADCLHCSVRTSSLLKSINNSHWPVERVFSPKSKEVSSSFLLKHCNTLSSALLLLLLFALPTFCKVAANLQQIGSKVWPNLPQFPPNFKPKIGPSHRQFCPLSTLNSPNISPHLSAHLHGPQTGQSLGLKGAKHAPEVAARNRSSNWPEVVVFVLPPWGLHKNNCMSVSGVFQECFVSVP